MGFDFDEWLVALVAVVGIMLGMGMLWVLVHGTLV